MTDNVVRSAIGEALDHPFAEEAFELVDDIESRVRDGDAGGELHEVAAELADQIVSALSIRRIATLWAVLDANDAAAENFGETSGTTLDRVTLDLFVVVEAAVFAALEAYEEERYETD